MGLGGQNNCSKSVVAGVCETRGVESRRADEEHRRALVDPRAREG